MTLPPTREFSGASVLRSVREDLAPYRDTIAAQHKRVSVIRFAADASDPSLWKRRMEASRVSAEQKVKAFTHLGYEVDHTVLPRSTSAADFAALIDQRNADPATSAVIVQYPPPPHLAPVVQRLDPRKDIDALLGERSMQVACATADGIVRVVRPFAQDNPTIAVVGARGFVGSGVVRLLEAEGHRAMPLDAGDDLGPPGRQADPATHHPGPRWNRTGRDGCADGPCGPPGRGPVPAAMDLPAGAVSVSRRRRGSGQSRAGVGGGRRGWSRRGGTRRVRPSTRHRAWRRGPGSVAQT